MSANCEYYQELMSCMLDGDLMKAETDALREHIKTCRECRKLCAAFSSMTLSLRDELEEPPSSFAEGVMNRIHTYEAQKALEEGETPAAEPVSIAAAPHRSHARKKTARWQPTLIAACLVLVIGGIGVTVLNGVGKSADSAAEVPGSYNRTTADTAAAESAVMGEAPEAEFYAAAPMETAAPAAMSEPMAMAEDAMETGAADEETTVSAGNGLSNPAFVPDGYEDAFEALLSDAGQRPEVNLHTIYAVERNGVIYEFLTDENEEYLFWRDAAEGFPILSPASVTDLWKIFE